MKIYKRIVLILPVLIFVLISNGKCQELSYLALGDSYTIGEGVENDQRWPVQLVYALRDSGIAISDPRIIAKTGWTTIDLKQAIDTSELKSSYNLVSLLIGVNDQYDGLNFEKYRGRFENLLIKAIQLAGGNEDHVFVVSIPDYSVTPFGQKKNPTTISRELVKYNAVNKSIADSLGISYLNITPHSRKASSDPSLLAKDGLHPSGKMYSQWVDKIVSVVLSKIKTWNSTPR